MYLPGYDDDNIYRLGSFLLDLDDPRRILARSKGFLIEPVEAWELKGEGPNVVFSTANPVADGKVYVYYGGADRVIGLATCTIDELMDFTLQRVTFPFYSEKTQRESCRSLQQVKKHSGGRKG
jgi:predicted GH43/DUF377 family glycosyl hydrolase